MSGSRRDGGNASYQSFTRQVANQAGATTRADLSVATQKLGVVIAALVSLLDAEVLALITYKPKPLTRLQWGFVGRLRA